MLRARQSHGGLGGAFELSPEEWKAYDAAWAQGGKPERKLVHAPGGPSVGSAVCGPPYRMRSTPFFTQCIRGVWVQPARLFRRKSRPGLISQLILCVGFYVPFSAIITRFYFIHKAPAYFISAFFRKKFLAQNINPTICLSFTFYLPLFYQISQDLCFIFLKKNTVAVYLSSYFIFRFG